MSKIRLHKKFSTLFNSNSRYFIITGGRGSSKSFSVTTWSALLMYYETGHTILFARWTMTSAHISIIPEFVEKLELLGISDEFEVTKTSITCTRTGSKIIFRGVKTSAGMQTANLKSLQGVTTLIFDESEELIDEEIADKIDLSIRQKGIQNRVIYIMNPATKTHWIYRRFFEEKGVQEGVCTIKDDTAYIHTTYLDNLNNLDESFIKSVEEMKKKNPKKYQHIMLGGWLNKAEGVIFTNWSVGEFNDDLDYGFGMDYGMSIDPTTLVKVAIDDKHKKIYLEELLYKPYLVTGEIYKIVAPLVGNKEIIGDNAEPRLIEELKRAGLNIKPCVKGAGSIAEGIAIMQDYELIVTPTSTNLIRELNNYVWNDKKSGSPVDMYNHIIDGIRYYISHILKQPKVKKYYVR